MRPPSTEVRAWHTGDDPEIRTALEAAQRVLEAFSTGEASVEDIAAAELRVSEVLAHYQPVEERQTTVEEQITEAEAEAATCAECGGPI